jgi:hypothetical protein
MGLIASGKLAGRTAASVLQIRAISVDQVRSTSESIPELEPQDGSSASTM